MVETNAMTNTNAFSTSYGIIVVTKDKKTVIIQRKIPYCVQDFLMKNKSLNINNYQESFLKNFLKSLSAPLKYDYLRFVCNLDFEDQYDFPHGQLQLNSKSFKKTLHKIENKSDQRTKDLKALAFSTAFREFKEETGYCFDISPKKIANLDTQLVRFIGLDNYSYTQLYFIVKVNKLKKCKNFKRDSFYNPLLIDIHKAVKLLEKQQRIKCDGKDKLLANILKQFQ